MTDRISPALTPEEWVGVRNGTVGIVGIPNAKANHQIAAVCLYGEPFGFTRKDVDLLREEARCCRDHWNQRLAALFFDELADRIAALLPPETP